MPSRRHDERTGAQPEGRSGDRIAKLLARAGIASRRDVERMIAEGRVALDGAVIDTPATVLTSLAGITVDGQPVAAPAPARLFLYHKPVGLLVTERDPRGRPTIYDRLPADLPRVVPVGRLDLATEGLLLLTTDGGFKRQLELPATGVERAYRARAYGTVTQAQLEDLMDGIEIEGVRYGPIDANIERRTGANVWIELVLAEGKNREVRRVLEHLGLQVSRLIRTRYGPFVLADLPPGEVGEVRQHELVAFRRTLKGGSPDEPIGLPAAEAPRAGFRTPATTDRAERTRPQPAPANRTRRPAGAAKPAHPAPTPRTNTASAPSRGVRAAATTDRSPRTRGPYPSTPDAGKGESDRPAKPRRASVAPGEPARPGFRAAATTDRAQRSRRPHPATRDGTPSLSHRNSEATRETKPSGGDDGDRPSRPPRSAAPPRPGAKPPRSTSPSPAKPGAPRGPRRPSR